MARKPRRRSIESRLTAVERGTGSLRASDAAIINELRDGFGQVETAWTRFTTTSMDSSNFMKLSVLSLSFFRLHREGVFTTQTPSSQRVSSR
jgi:hypothetical protein